jgi:hypothetical protein
MNMVKHETLSRLATSCRLNISARTGAMGRIASFIAAAIFTGAAHGAAIADFGTNAPTPGASDASQLVSSGTSGTLDGLNYYSNNGNPPGQTFTTGSNPAGYAMPTLYVQTGGYGNGGTATAAHNYNLRIFSVSGGVATLISTYNTDNAVGFTDGDWMKYYGLTNILQPNTVYAYTHQSTAGYDGMATTNNNPYAGGEICLIPTAGGGVIYGSTHTCDAVFDINLVPLTDPYLFPTYINPSSAIVGNTVVISAGNSPGFSSGTQPFSYQWLFNGTNIHGATSLSYTIASVQVTNSGTYSLVSSNRPGGIPTVITNTPASLFARTAYNIFDYGATAPIPGVYDIAQLTLPNPAETTGNSAQDGLNYYADSNPTPGQTFTTGANPSGYTLTAIYLKTAGLDGNSTTVYQNYTLNLYSISGSTATLISSYTTDNTIGFPDGDWLKYSGMTNTLQPNTVYAYSHHRNGTGWDLLSAWTNAVYAGGQACVIPTSGNSVTVTYGTNSATPLEANFDVAMVPNGFPAIQNVTISALNTAGGSAVSTYVTTPVTLAVQASGTAPLHFDWQTDNGSSGLTWTDIPSSNTNSYSLNTTSLTPQTYEYQVIVTNVNSIATSSVVTLNLSAASAPILVNDTTINPSGLYVNGQTTMTATFNGSQPITYQWMFNNGTGAVAISGATNNTYTISSAQLTNSGSYYLTANNAISPYTTSSDPTNLLVGIAGQNNTTLAGMFDTGLNYSQAPTPGTYDISQLIVSIPGAPANLNYYVDNGNPPGQTFTTLGAPPGGNAFQLSSIYVQEEFNSYGGAAGTNCVYVLGIYLVSGNNADLLTAYYSTNQPYITNTASADPQAIVDGDWIKWSGLTNILNINSTYAFSVQRTVGGGWWRLANDSGSGDLYSGGQAALLPGGGIGALAFSTDPTVDATFDVALSPATVSGTTLHIGTAHVSGGNFVLTGSGGTAGSGYSVVTQTNLAQPRVNWTVIGTGTFNGSGNFSNSIAVTPGGPKQFYQIRVP